MNETKVMNHCYFMHLKTTSLWLSMSPTQRAEFVDTILRPVLKQHPTVTLRFFDSEAFSADVSDIALWETSDVLAYQSLIEHLRETPFWGQYFEIVRIVASIENAFAMHYNVAPL